MATLGLPVEEEQRPSLTLAVDVQGCDEFLDAMKQMDAAVGRLCDRLERMSVISRALRKTFHITNNYHITCSGDHDKED